MTDATTTKDDAATTDAPEAPESSKPEAKKTAAKNIPAAVANVADILDPEELQKLHVAEGSAGTSTGEDVLRYSHLFRLL